MSNFLSIIVPVYNTPINDLKRCFESLKNQSLREFDLIVVDDESTEEVATYLEGLRNQFDNINILHAKHAGVSASRNLGLKSVTTPYVAFSDADDEYSREFVKEAKEYIDEYNPEMIFGVLEEIPDCKKLQTDSKVHYYNNPNDMREVYKAFLKVDKNQLGFYISPSQCARVYSSSLACSVMYYEEVYYGEDRLFNRQCLTLAKSVLFVPNVWYYYYSNDYSCTHRKYDSLFEFRKSFYDAYVELNKSEDEETKKLLWELQYQKIYQIIAADVFDKYGVFSFFKGINLKKEFKKVLENAMDHPFFSEAVKGLGKSKDIDFASRTFIYLLNRKKYGILLLCCLVVRQVRRIKRRIFGRRKRQE